MVKPTGPLCNLECRYCYYLEKEHLYPGSAFRMSDEVLEAFTRQYIRSQRTPEIDHVAPAMRFMADALRRHEPPAGIMDVLARGADPTLSEAYPLPTGP